MDRFGGTILAGIILLSLTLTGCRQKNNAPDVSAVAIERVDIHRYEQALFEVDLDHIGQGLESIHQEFSLFLGDNYKDTLNITRIFEFLTDPMIRDLKRKTDEVYPDLTKLEEGLTEAFRYWKYYFPSDTLPSVFSYISGLYYEAPIEYFGQNMIISLDLFLGRDFEPYRAIGLPQYTVRRMAPEYIVPESMKQVGMSHLPADLAPRTLLDHMILHGKVLFFLDAVLPSYNDTLKTGYTLAQEAWCKDNEASFWSLLLEDELLFSTDPFVVNKFILDGPFTSGLPKESPGMLGRWTGWQIVRKYMATYPNTGLGGLFAIEDSQRILSESRYKPSRR